MSSTLLFTVLFFSLCIFFPSITASYAHNNHQSGLSPMKQERQRDNEMIGVMNSINNNNIHQETFYPSQQIPAHYLTQCNQYSRKDDCTSYVPIRKDNLPACGKYAGITANTTVFALIGDYGLDEQCEAHVASLVDKFNQQFGKLDFLVSLGDNGYWNGKCSELASGVEKYYGDYFQGGVNCHDPQKNQAGETPDTQHFTIHPETALLTDKRSNQPIRFFPTIGNHDWDTFNANWTNLPYSQYFSYLNLISPSQAIGTYYSYKPVDAIEIFSLNSNLGVDGKHKEDYNTMVNWAKNAITSSNATYKIVFFHHPPACTAQHDKLSPHMDLPYEEWGATMVINGHEHVYERIVHSVKGNKKNGDGIPYIVNGLGGHSWLYDINHCSPFPGSQFRYNAFHGAMLAILSHDATPTLDFCFYSVEDGGKLEDHFTL